MTQEQMKKEALIFYRQICHLKDQNRAMFYLWRWLSNTMWNQEASQLLTMVNKFLIEYKNNPDEAPRLENGYVSISGCSLE